MNQIALASVMMQLRMNDTKQVDEGMVRHMILNSIRNYVMQFKSEYVENDADVTIHSTKRVEEKVDRNLI